LFRIPLIAPEPLAPIPVTLVVLLLVQLLPLVIAIVEILAPEQTDCDAGVPDTETDVVVTVTAEVIAVPAQPLRFGVIVNVTVVFEIRLVFVTVPLISPVPLDAIPVTVVVAFLVQLKTVPAKFPLTVIGVILEPEQTDCDVTDATAFGLGLTITVAVIGEPVQEAEVGVIVNVTVIGAPVLLVNVPLILPVPLAAMPVTEAVLSLVQLYVKPLVLLLS
jgi:hypothetical protein